MPRLFIGVPVPETHRRLLAALTDDLSVRLRSKVKWVAPENAHLTLKFLGSVEENEVAGITIALGNIAFPSFEARLEGVGVFPNAKRPRVAWVGMVDGVELCGQLAEKVETAMASVGFEREERPFRAHLTLGRIKTSGDDWAAILRETDASWPAFTVDRFVLWESVLKPTGAEYRVVETFLLK